MVYRRVLVVDDNHDAANALVMLLDLAGYEAFVAFSGDEAVDAALEHRPDVVLLDINMPGLTGHEVCRLLRSESWGAEVTIIGISGRPVDEEEAKARESGCNHYLAKPVMFDDLKRLIDNSLTS